MTTPTQAQIEAAAEAMHRYDVEHGLNIDGLASVENYLPIATAALTAAAEVGENTTLAAAIRTLKDNDSLIYKSPPEADSLRDWVGGLATELVQDEILEEIGSDLDSAIIARVKAATIERCAQVAKAHKGSAEKRRRANGRKYDEESLVEIRAEERGEDIAAEMIAAEIRALKD